MSCFVYKWTHLPTLMWYVGSRTSKRSRLNDGYICSAPKIKKMILDNPSQWERTIIAIGDAQEMFNLETEILQLFDARNDDRSFNNHNNDKKFTRTGTSWNGVRAGKNNPMYGKIPWNKGLTKDTNSSLIKVGEAARIRQVGKQRPEHAEHMRKIMKGKSSNFTKEAYAKSAATRMGKKRGPYKKRDSNVR